MKYFVRNQDGELHYDSYAQVLSAASSGLIDPTDEVRREDEKEWKKASSIAGLFRAAAPVPLWKRGYSRTLLFAVLGSVFAFWAIHRGNSTKSVELTVTGIAVAFAVAGVLFKVTQDAQKRK